MFKSNSIKFLWHYITVDEKQSHHYILQTSNSPNSEWMCSKSDKFVPSAGKVIAKIYWAWYSAHRLSVKMQNNY